MCRWLLNLLSEWFGSNPKQEECQLAKNKEVKVENYIEETYRPVSFAEAYRELTSRIRKKLSQNQPFYFETTRGKKHEAIYISPEDVIRIKRTDAPAVPEYNINIETLELTFNHFRFRETITIKQYDTFVRKTLRRGANHGPTYIAIIRALQRISRGL